ncbi:MAG: hypothetical protein QNL88_03550, partial [Acidobacteriota bacterium]|nr:hypothetical protein [Acidobacteriota bacterium]
SEAGFVVQQSRLHGGLNTANNVQPISATMSAEVLTMSFLSGRSRVIALICTAAMGWIGTGCVCRPGAGGCEDYETSGDYELVRVLEVAGRQGIATDGERYFVSGSTAFYVYSRDGELLESNEDPFLELEKPANHIGDISVFDGELFAGVEWFVDGRGRDIQIAVYDAETLRYKKAIDWEPESGQVEVSALAVDAANGLVWTTDWVDGRYIYRYDMATGTYAGKLHLRPVPQWQQGIAAFDGSLYITADDGDAEDDEVDNLWRLDPETGATSAYVHHEKAFAEFRRFGEIEGLDFDPENGEMLVLANRGKRIVLGMPTGLYPGYDREIHEVYVYRIHPQILVE